MFNVKTLSPHGFCMGVKMAIEKALHALDVVQPVYCLHALVHNEGVIAELRGKGLRVVDDLDDVPRGATVLFSAHGVAPEVRRAAEARALHVIDATCPFVARVHRQVRDDAARGLFVVVIGHADHVEVRGIVGEARAAGARVAVVATPQDVAALAARLDPRPPIGVVSQTTLSGDDLREILDALEAAFPQREIHPASDICTATRDRQEAVRRFVAAGGDGVLVLGSATSSNTRRLAEIATAAGARRVWRVATPEDLAVCDFSGLASLGVTSGASTPEAVLHAVLARLQSPSTATEDAEPAGRGGSSPASASMNCAAASTSSHV